MRTGIGVMVVALLAFAALGQTTEWIDDFDGSLEPGWFWVRESPDQWSLTDRAEFLRIATEPGGLLYNSNNAQNLLLRDTPAGDYEIETLVYYEPVENYQIAGLVIYEDDDNFVLLGRAFCKPCGGNKVYFDLELKATPVPNKSIITTSKGVAYLKITKQGHVYSGYYSDNGTKWTLVIEHRSWDMRPIGVGIVTTGNAPDGVPVVADFGYFRITELPASGE